LIAEAKAFPALATEYFDRAPGQVLAALASGFAQLGQVGALRVADPRHAAAHDRLTWNEWIFDTGESRG
jgi:TetR/AcrR family transcriptional repressor of mexJK operon